MLSRCPGRRRVWTLASVAGAVLGALLRGPAAAVEVVEHGAHRVRVGAVYRHFRSGAVTTDESNREQKQPVKVTMYCSGGMPSHPYHSNPANHPFCNGELSPVSFTVVDQEGRVFQVERARFGALVAQLAARQAELVRAAQIQQNANARAQRFAEIDRALARGEYAYALRELARWSPDDTLAAGMASRRSKAIRGLVATAEQLLADANSKSAFSLLETGYDADPSRSDRRALDVAARKLVDAALRQGAREWPRRALDALARAGVEGSWMDVRRAEALLLDGMTGPARDLAAPLLENETYRVRATRVMAELALRDGELDAATRLAGSLGREDWRRTPLDRALLASILRARAEAMVDPAAGPALIEEIHAAEQQLAEDPLAIANLAAARAAVDRLERVAERLAEIERLRASAAAKLAAGEAGAAEAALSSAANLASHRDVADAVRVAVRREHFVATLSALEAGARIPTPDDTTRITRVLLHDTPGNFATAAALADRVSRIATDKVEPGTTRHELLFAAAAVTLAGRERIAAKLDGPGADAVERYLSDVARISSERLEARQFHAAADAVLAAEPFAKQDPAVYVEALEAAAFGMLLGAPELAEQLSQRATAHGAGLRAALGRLVAARVRQPLQTLAGVIAIVAVVGLVSLWRRCERRLRRIRALRAQVAEFVDHRLDASTAPLPGLLAQLRQLGDRDERLWTLEADMRLQAGLESGDLVAGIERHFAGRSPRLAALALCLSGEPAKALALLRNEMVDAPLDHRLLVANRICSAGGTPGVLLERARILLLAGRDDDAFEAVRLAQREERSLAAADLLAVIALRRGDAKTLLEAARAMLAERTAPNGGAGALLAAVRGLEELGEPGMALKLLDETLPEGLAATERAHLEARVRAQEVEATLPGLEARVDSGDTGAARALGEAYASLGRPGDALRVLQKAAQTSPPSRRDLCTMGVLYLEHGQPSTAARLLQRYLDSAEPGEPPDLGAMYHLGLALEAEGQWAPALEWHQRVYEVDIDFLDVEERIAALANAKSSAPVDSPSTDSLGCAGPTVACVLCGGANRAGCRFCRDCGVALEVSNG